MLEAQLISSHTLDSIITHFSFLSCAINIDLPSYSDHCLIIFYLTLSRSAPATQQHRVIRRLGSIDRDRFITAVQQSTMCSNVIQLTNSSITDLRNMRSTTLRNVLDNKAQNTACHRYCHENI